MGDFSDYSRAVTTPGEPIGTTRALLTRTRLEGPACLPGWERAWNPYEGDDEGSMRRASRAQTEVGAA